MKDPVTAWLDAETKFSEPEVVPLETEEEKVKRLIETANKKPLSPDKVFDSLHDLK